MTFAMGGVPHAGPQQWFDLLAVQGTLKSLLLCCWKRVFVMTSAFLPGAGERHSTRDKGHEEGGSAYAKAGSSLGSAPR